MSAPEVHYWLETRRAAGWWRRLLGRDDWYIVSSMGALIGPLPDERHARVCAVAAAIVLELAP